MKNFAVAQAALLLVSPAFAVQLNYKNVQGLATLRSGARQESDFTVTKSGKACIDWASAALYQDTAEGTNHCANPDGNPGGDWCFFGPTAGEFELCEQPLKVPMTTPPTEDGIFCEVVDEVMSWDASAAFMTEHGYRMLNVKELQDHIEATPGFDVSPDTWAAVENPDAPNGRDWVQVGQYVHANLGSSHFEVYGFSPHWEDNQVAAEHWHKSVCYFSGLECEEGQHHAGHACVTYYPDIWAMNDGGEIPMVGLGSPVCLHAEGVLRTMLASGMADEHEIDSAVHTRDTVCQAGSGLDRSGDEEM